jgi:hypothetical protein
MQTYGSAIGRIVGNGQTRRHLGRVDAENVAGGAMQSDETEVAGLEDAVFVVEEQPHAVGRVIPLGLERLMRDKFNVRVGAGEQRDQRRRHRASQAAAVLLLKLHRIGEPPHRVSERADREHHRDFAIAGVVIMRQQLLVAEPDLDPEAYEIPLAAVDPAGHEFGAGFEDRVVRVEVLQPYSPRLSCFRQEHPTTVVEIKVEAVAAVLRRLRRRRRVGWLGRARIGFRRGTGHHLGRQRHRLGRQLGRRSIFGRRHRQRTRLWGRLYLG